MPAVFLIWCPPPEPGSLLLSGFWSRCYGLAAAESPEIDG